VRDVLDRHADPVGDQEVPEVAEDRDRGCRSSSADVIVDSS
jgi:hypothetical protein